MLEIEILKKEFKFNFKDLSEIDIPEKESISAIKERVSSKWDLNREIDKLERFSKRNAEELIKNRSGVVLSRWEFENLQKEQKRLNARLLREIESYGNIKPTQYGKKQKDTYFLNVAVDGIKQVLWITHFHNFLIGKYFFFYPCNTV